MGAAAKSTGDTNPVSSANPVYNVDPLTGQPVSASGGATGPGTAAAATRVTFASDAPAIGVTPSKLGTTTRLPLWATGQVLTTSATSAASTAITGTEVMISATQDCWIKIGATTPTAAKDTAGSMFIAKGGPYTFQLTSGHLVAAVQDSAAGKVSILPVA